MLRVKYALPPHIQNSTLYPPNLLENDNLAAKLVKKSMSSLLREK